MLKRLIRPLVPKALLSAYHYSLARFSATLSGHPSERLIVIGVTGTSGKSTTSYMLARMFEAMGVKVGLASTIMFKVGNEEQINDQKMTMVGRFQLQGLLKKMVLAGCKYAIVETTSEGIVQHRQLGIHYDMAVFTNLYPEHIQSHGSFENYKNAKLKLFSQLEQAPEKVINGEPVIKTIVANGEDEHAADFLNFDVEKKIEFSQEELDTENEHLRATKVKIDGSGLTFFVSGQEFNVPVLGAHNVYNALAAISVGRALGFSFKEMAEALKKVTGIPGRIELIDQGQPFTVIVDYAFESRALARLYEAIEQIDHKRVIHVFGATGGGRDTSHRKKNAELISKHAKVVIVTNEDPYDDDPMEIINDVARHVSKKVELHKILDRKEAIEKAVSLAKDGDIVLITGKGSEQAIVVKNGKQIPWDDRQEARNALAHL